MRFSTLTEWLDWQSDLHPSEIELGLQRVADVWGRLCPAGLASRVVTVAGTNGKGSCVALLDAIYRQAGYRVATYTSPHLVHYNERIRLDGVAVGDQALCQAFDAVDRARGDTSLTYFEFGTLAALHLFAQATPDLVILEVGLGGRLDAVNIVDADLAVITTIDIDHADWLGDSREAIGREKAGILRPGRPAVLADPDMPASVLDEAERIGAQVLMADRDFHARELAEGWCWSGPGGVEKRLPLPALQGAGCLQNAAAVVMACERLKPWFDIADRAIAEGMEKVRLPGRLQLLPGPPRVLLDVAHNRQAVEGLRRSLDRIAPQARILAVFGLLNDKDAGAVADILGERIGEWHLVDLGGSRGRSSRALGDALREGGVVHPLYTWHDFSSAYDAAASAATGDDLILVFGSFLLVGEAMHDLGIA